MAKRRGKRRSSGRRGIAKCSPIRVKCKIPSRSSPLVPRSMSLQERLRAFKAKRAIDRAIDSGEPWALQGLGKMRGARKGKYCTVKIGSGKARRMTPAAAGALVKKALNRARARCSRCCIPKVIRG